MSKVVENYIIKEKIGQGMYGNVHLSEHLKTKNYYAVKIVKKEMF